MPEDFLFRLPREFGRPDRRGATDGGGSTRRPDPPPGPPPTAARVPSRHDRTIAAAVPLPGRPSGALPRGPAAMLVAAGAVGLASAGSYLVLFTTRFELAEIVALLAGVGGLILASAGLTGLARHRRLAGEPPGRSLDRHAPRPPSAATTPASGEDEGRYQQRRRQRRRQRRQQHS